MLWRVARAEFRTFWRTHLEQAAQLHEAHPGGTCEQGRDERLDVREIVRFHSGARCALLRGQTVRVCDGTLNSMSLFDSGKAQLKDGSTRVMVDALEMIKAHPDKRILVAGYTDNVGSPDSNLKLSTARAEAVRDWLIEVSGIPATQFAIQGYGDTRPIKANDTEAGRAKNRRVEITLVPDAPHG